MRVSCTPTPEKSTLVVDGYDLEYVGVPGNITLNLRCQGGRFVPVAGRTFTDPGTSRSRLGPPA
jgi:hypothetical protein